MVFVLSRAFAIGVVGMWLAVMIALLVNPYGPNGHLLLLEGRDALHLVVYCSAFLGAGFGAVVGAISAAAEIIAASTNRDQLRHVQPITRLPTGKPG